MNLLNKESLISAMMKSAIAHQPGVAGYLNAATINLAFSSSDYAKKLKMFDLLYPDGMAVVWGARLHKIPVPERLSAADFMQSWVCAMAEARIRIALIGGKPDEAESAAHQFQNWAPNLKITCCHHGYFDNPDLVLNKIEQSKADIVLIGMGSPIQETLALKWLKQSPRFYWCVGALFEYYSGRQRAPLWMRKSGLEWLFRLILEPKRLWKRYLLGNPAFIFRVITNSKIA